MLPSLVRTCGAGSLDAEKSFAALGGAVSHEARVSADRLAEEDQFLQGLELMIPMMSIFHMALFNILSIFVNLDMLQESEEGILNAIRANVKHDGWWQDATG